MQLVGGIAQGQGCGAVRQLIITAASHPKHKATKLMTKRRPKKRNQSDRNHKPAEYAALPPPPPEYVTISE